MWLLRAGRRWQRGSGEREGGGSAAPEGGEEVAARLWRAESIGCSAVLEERGIALDGGERRGGMKQNNYQPVR